MTISPVVKLITKQTKEFWVFKWPQGRREEVKSMKKLFSVLFLIVLFSCGSEKKAERPRDPWVFRSVLDEQPRMVTAALHDNMWLAYSAQNATLYKAWKGGVNFDGAVYTTVHGPQPTSKGYAYINDSKAEQWMLKKGSEMIAGDVQYKGHRTDQDRVVFTAVLTTPEGEKITVKEQPSYVRRGNQNGLNRQFTVENATTYEVVLSTTIHSLLVENDYSTTGEFEVTGQQKLDYPNGSVLNVSGNLLLPAGQTDLKVFFHAGFDSLGERPSEEGEEETLPLGAQLIERSDCHSCHNENVKTVGPSYLSVARKYNDSEETMANLAQKIIQGGYGVWGVAAMTAHPDLLEEDAIEMVRYILTLDDKDEGGAMAKYTLGIKSIPLQLGGEFDAAGGAGFMVHAYKNYEQKSLNEVIDNDTPVKNGVMSNLHILDARDFDEYMEDFVLKITGKINIKKDGSYDFRLISDDGSYLYIDGKEIIDNSGWHGPTPVDGEMYLTAGMHDIAIHFQQGGGGAALSLQWYNRETEQFELLDDQVISYTASNVEEVVPIEARENIVKEIPGDARPLEAVHPAFDLFPARPHNFKPRVGGIDFFSDGRMAVCTWDSLGPVYVVENWQTGDSTQMTVKRIASGLAEPLGLKIVDDELYVLQKQELTKLIDHDGDQVIDEYQTVSDGWKVSSNFHEFAFGLVYKDGFFYATLATAIMPGGASADPQIPDRGKVVRINKETGASEFIAHGLRTPNGIGLGMNGEIFVADNQGDWLPSSKIVHIQEGEWYGSRSVDFEGTADLEEKLPVAWLPQDEIGNSPSTPVGIEVGPYKGQMIHGEVTHGGVKRVFVEEVEGQLQGALFRFTQGLEAGINRIVWAPDGSLIVGGVGSTGNWGHTGKLWYGLQRLVYNEKSAFEMLKVEARSNGFEITFTEPIDPNVQLEASDFMIQRWYYKPTAEYGGPKLGLTELKPTQFSVSEDRKKVAMTLPGLKENHMVYFRIVRPFSSASGNPLWTTESWYTLNKIPTDKPVQHGALVTAHNTLSDEEKAAGWKLLFDGRSTTGLRNFKSETVGNKWVAQKGTLHFKGKNAAGKGGDVIITDKEYQDYELYLEWKIATGGNSGIIYNVVESDEYDYVWQTGPEMQILDNVRHSDGQIVKHRAGDLYDLIECETVVVNEPEVWNKAKIVMKDGKVQHWLNGYKVVETEFWTPEWDQMVAGSKFKDMPGFGTARKGHIALQDHSDPVWFRNIKIREL